VIVLTAAAPDAGTAALGHTLRALDDVVLVAPERPPGLDEGVAFIASDLTTATGAEVALAAAEATHASATCVVTVPAPARAATVDAITDGMWDSTLAANQTAAMHSVRAAARLLSGRGAGRIALIGWRFDRAAGWGHVSATSGAIRQIARSLASEVGPRSVTVNAIMVPLGRLVDAAGAIRLLLSEDAGYLTGEILTPSPVDLSGTGPPAGGASGLAGRVALVTGAGQGIGAAIAERLGNEGAVVAVNSLQPKKAESTAERLRGRGVRAEAFPADVAERDQVDDLVRSVEARLGTIEILVNNAAVLSMERLTEMDLADWHRQIAVNLTGPLQLSRRVIPSMVGAAWGRIVNVSSIWGLVGARGATAYSAAKGGLIELTQAMAEEVGPNGVRVSAIAPGVVSTPQLAADAAFAGITVPEMERRYALDTLLGRIGTAHEIAGVVAFLASDAGAPFGGQTIAVTGGRAE
jgi:NAD(P)-dependent dehydrogenase (short-subunit alcohol dehydrogenase family)